MRDRKMGIAHKIPVLTPEGYIQFERHYITWRNDVKEILRLDLCTQARDRTRMFTVMILNFP
jgi:hypothetical protein